MTGRRFFLFRSKIKNPNSSIPNPATAHRHGGRPPPEIRSRDVSSLENWVKLQAGTSRPCGTTDETSALLNSRPPQPFSLPATKLSTFQPSSLPATKLSTFQPFSLSAFQPSSLPAFQLFSFSAFQLFSFSAFQLFSFSAFQPFSLSPLYPPSIRRLISTPCYPQISNDLQCIPPVTHDPCSEPRIFFRFFAKISCAGAPSAVSSSRNQ